MACRENASCSISRSDVNRVRALLENDASDKRHNPRALRKLQDMTDYCETTTAGGDSFSTILARIFPKRTAGHAITATIPRNWPMATGIARTIIRCVRELPSHFGIELITDVLTGAKSARIRRSQLDGPLPTIPEPGYSKQQYRIWIHDLIRQDYLFREGDKYPVIGLSSRSLALLNGQVQVMLPVPEREYQKSKVHKNNDTIPYDEKLFLQLKNLRKSIADQENVPPYVIFHDASLKEMARIKPDDSRNFRTIGGVGDHKLEKYGPAFIAAIRAFQDEQGTGYTKNETPEQAEQAKGPDIHRAAEP